jgi:hypothetical protein
MRPSTRITTRRVPGATLPWTSPYETWYAAGRSTTGGRGGVAGGGGLSITGEP